MVISAGQSGTQLAWVPWITVEPTILSPCFRSPSDRRARDGFSLGKAKPYRRPPAFFWAFFSRRGRRCLFFGRNFPFFMDAPGGGASCVAPASEACSSATESVAFAALALIFCLALGASGILFSGAVEFHSSHFFKITSRGLRVERRIARTRESASTNKNVFATRRLFIAASAWM